MEEFLKTTARHYLAKVSAQARASGQPSTLPFTRYLFCFPNRRSGLFFSRYLQHVLNDVKTKEDEKNMMPCCVPAITTIDELFGHFSTRHVIDRTALLFRLYQVYDRLSHRRVRETFDQFVFWGDMLLSDFDDVDKYMVDADMLFANVRELKEIDARFAGLTPEQVKVIRGFWTSFRPEDQYPEGDKHEVFAQTWSILADLYHTLRNVLAERNEAYSGMMQREVVERLKACDEGDPFASLPYDKVVFVGLTAVSKVDRQLFSLLRLHGRAEFCWDYADPRLKPEGSKATSAAYFSKSNLADFENELSDEELQQGLVPDQNREVTLYAVSSGVGQTQKARDILERWRERDGENFDSFRTAVVLPDENLLLPMLYAVPQDFKEFNVTMGYGLKNTPIAAFVGELMSLQLSWRAAEGTFFFRQVLPVLAHPYSLGMTMYDEVKRLSAARDKTCEIASSNLYQIPASKFADNPFLSMIFRPVTSAVDALDYLAAVLDCLMERAARCISLSREEQYDGQLELDFQQGESGEQLFSDTDYEFLYHYRKTITSLREQVLGNDIAFTPKTLFLLLEKLVAGVSVPFSGEPLKGLQVMGVLETRALDFENVIILSMNEGTFPAKPSQNTFVPMSLRDAFGMPTQRHRDSVFAYHFYRLISRARRLAMIYDSRSEGLNTGEESRYVKQLRYLMGYSGLKAQTVSDDIRMVSPTEIVVRKTPEVMAQLRECLGPEGKRYLSASVLKNYIQCPLKFYLGFVRQLREDEDVSESMDSALFGDILHDAIRRIYSYEKSYTVHSDKLKEYVDHPEQKIARCVREAFLSHPKIQSVEGYNRLLEGLVVDYVTETLRHDMSLCPFVYLKGEAKHRFVYDAGNGLLVRMKCVYDRLDQNLNTGTVRIVDYKTGSSSQGGKLVIPELDALFSPDSKGLSEAFQVMLYCLMLEQASPEMLASVNLAHKPPQVSPHLYFVRDFRARQEVNTCLTVGAGKASEPVVDFSVYRDEFRKRLSNLLAEIFNPEVPFVQGHDTHSCGYCAFANLCNRTK